MEVAGGGANMPMGIAPLFLLVSAFGCAHLSHYQTMLALSSRPMFICGEARLTFLVTLACNCVRPLCVGFKDGCPSHAIHVDMDQQFMVANLIYGAPGSIYEAYTDIWRIDPSFRISDKPSLAIAQLWRRYVELSLEDAAELWSAMRLFVQTSYMPVLITDKAPNIFMDREFPTMRRAIVVVAAKHGEICYDATDVGGESCEYDDDQAYMYFAHTEDQPYAAFHLLHVFTTPCEECEEEVEDVFI